MKPATVFWKPLCKTTSPTILFKDVATTSFKQKPTVKLFSLRNVKHSLSSRPVFEINSDF